MPDPTDPLSRLDRLAPSVDPDAATTAFAHRRAARTRRRWALAGVASGLVLLAAGAAVAVAVSGDGGQTVLAGSTTEAPAETTTSTGYVGGEVRTVTDGPGLTLAMSSPRTAAVGERMWVDVTLTNDRGNPVTLDMVAPCDEPLGALAGSPDAVSAVQADVGVGAFSVDPPGGAGTGLPWTGDLEDLPAALRDGEAPKVFAGRLDSQLASTWTECLAMAPAPEVLGPGSSLTRRIAIDLRWLTPASVDGEVLDVLASTGPVRDSAGNDLGRVSVRQPVTLLDPEDRQRSYEAAVGAPGIAAAPTLRAWRDETLDLGPERPPGVVQRYTVGLAWWNGAWEAWLTPERGSGGQTDPLRIRFDPERMGVVDVRTVSGNQAPSDDPDRPEPAAPVDRIRFHED